MQDPSLEMEKMATFAQKLAMPKGKINLAAEFDSLLAQLNVSTTASIDWIINANKFVAKEEYMKVCPTMNEIWRIMVRRKSEQNGENYFLSPLFKTNMMMDNDTFYDQQKGSYPSKTSPTQSNLLFETFDKAIRYYRLRSYQAKRVGYVCSKCNCGIVGKTMHVARSTSIYCSPACMNTDLQNMYCAY